MYEEKKAQCPSDLSVDIWKLQGLQDKAVTRLTDFFYAITDAGHSPSTWAMSIRVPIFKNRGDSAVCSNYSPIQLLSHTMKVFEWILDQHISKVACNSVN